MRQILDTTGGMEQATFYVNNLHMFVTAQLLRRFSSGVKKRKTLRRT